MIKTPITFHSSLAKDLDGYISLKQALGRQFHSAIRVLLKLDRFLFTLSNPSPDLTTETFKQWCQTMEMLSPNTRLAWMHIVKNFCFYRRRLVPECFVPDATQFPLAIQRIRPYIFSEKDVEQLLNFCAFIPDSVRSPLRGTATRLAIILLYTTGIRRGELLRLTARDYDPSAQTLLIRESKFYKSRLLPLPVDVAAEVSEFIKIRNNLALAVDAPLISSPYNCSNPAFSAVQLRKNFNILLRLADIKTKDGQLPRIHDFRFSFAVNALVRWYNNGIDVQTKLPFLATWLGHYSVLSTYHYLCFIEPLRLLASNRFAQCYGGLVKPALEQNGGK
jgi:integrase/recombinase XerD